MIFWEILLRVTQIVFVFLGIFGLYNVLFSWRLFGPYKTPEGPTTPYHRFAVVTSARNEEQVIGNLIKSLQKMDYPKDCFEIFVIADNCSDQTAAIARSLGATVLERFNETKQSKGYALNWFFKIFFKEYKDTFDSCLILDADNLVDKDYLTIMNQQRNLGRQVIVGYRHGKNPEASAIAGCNSLFWLMQRRAHDHPRAALGLSLLSAGGSGFVFDLELIRETGWSTQTITEDIEFALNMIERDVVVHYANTAKNYDEQPTTWEQTARQQLRWKVGTKQLWSLKSLTFLKMIFQGKLRAIDPFFYLQGFLAMILAPVNWVLNLLSNVILTGDWLGLLQTLAISAVVGYLGLFLFGLYLVLAERQRWPGRGKALLLFPFFMIATTLIFYQALFTQNPKWTPIKHEDTKSIEDIEERSV